MKKNRTITIKLSIFVIIPLVICCGCAANAVKQEQADVHKNIGISYLGAGQFTEALKEFLLAEKITPQDPEIHYFLGIAYHEKGLNDKSIDEFKKAIALRANYSEAHNYLGTIYMDRGHLDEAIDSFKKALSNELYGTPVLALYNMGVAYHKKGMDDAAISKYNEAIARGQSSILVPLIEKEIGIILFKKGDTDNAVKHFQKSLELSPSLVESHYWLGVCFLKLKDYESAISAF
jgi:tetratricopeptide (TPR) repeat protein